MSGHDDLEAWRKGPTFLQAAYQRAEAAQRPLDRQKSNVIPFPKTLTNIRRHKHIPVLAPKGVIRRVPDREAFMRVEAQDRLNAIRKRKSMQSKKDFAKAAKVRPQQRQPDRGLER